MEGRPQGTETILIVDDDELVRRSAVTLMASLGYRVLSAGSGSEALEVLRQDTSINLLFTDVFMPGGMHGPQLVAAARRLRPELKLLFTSGYFEYAEIRHALDPSIEQVSKPYDRDALAAILRRTLDGRGGVPDDRPTDEPR
jgi:CheY-like chemotaxis protein